MNKIQLVVFDWAGTMVDYASSAPADTFQKVFQDMNIHLTREEINGPMGTEKKHHIRTLLSMPEVNDQWISLHKRPWTEEDINDIFEVFEKTLYETVASYSDPLEGVVETMNALKKEGIHIGSTTGYLANIMTRVIPAAKAKGVDPECVVTPDVTGGGRPAPFMIFECMRHFNVYPPAAVVKVGDTIVDMQEGKNAGAWSVGVLKGSNLLGLSEKEYEAMDLSELKKRKEDTRQKFLSAGADLVIDTMKELPAAIRQIEER